jgi:BREX protein BrxB
MSSLKDSIALLESDLKADPPRISVYHDLPFAILRYDPTAEWDLRREIKLLETRLVGVGKEVHIIPMSDLLWSALDRVHEKDDDEGLEAVIELEKQRGFVEAQQQVTTYLSSKVWVPLWDLLAERLASIDPENSVVFLTRVAAMSPGIFHMSMLLDKMHGKTKATTILFYPGSIEGTTGLRFMDLKDRDALGNYRVKIYG